MPQTSEAPARTAHRRERRRKRGGGLHQRRARRRWRPIDYPRAGKRGLRRWLPSWKLLSVLLLGPPLILTGVCVAVYIQVKVPGPDSDSTMQATVMTYADGSVLGTVGVTSRRDVTLAQIPPTVQHAVLAAEDRGFYQEQGVSPQGIARAVIADLRGQALQGGSTITQQYVKNAFLTSARTASRKITEIFISVKLARQQSKDTILQDYLNTIYFGRGAYGIEAAAQAYFGRDVGALDVAQAAYLGAVIQSPSAYDPVANPQIRPVITARWNYVVQGMVSSGWLPADQARTLAFPTLQPLHRSAPGDQTPYLMALVGRELNNDGISDQQVATSGLTVRTTLQRPVQQAAVTAVDKQVLAHLSAHRAVDKDVRIGLVSLRSSDGAILALYSGRDFDTSQYNDATQSSVTAGQIFNPLSAAAMVVAQGGTLSGAAVNRASAVPDNSKFKRLAPTMRAVVKRMGIPAKAPGLSTTYGLYSGDIDASVLDVTEAYATLANEGGHTTPHVVDQVSGAHGVLYRADTTVTPVLNQQAGPPGLLCQMAYAPVTTAWQTLEAPSMKSFPADPGADCGVTGASLFDDDAWAVDSGAGMTTAMAVFREGPDLKPALKAQSLAGVAGLKNVTGGSLPAKTVQALLAALMK